MIKTQVEKRDAHSKNIMLAIGALLVMLIAGVVFVKSVYHRDFKKEAVRNQTAEQTHFPQPQPGHFTARSLIELRAQEDSTLKTYRWTNDQHTEAQVPIDRALEIYEAHHDQ